jgi:5'-3' exoribonuclease 2
MGIKQFFQWFRRRYQHCIYAIPAGCTLKSVITPDTALIDLNGIFHQAAQRVYQYGDYAPRKNLINPEPRPPIYVSEENNRKVYKQVCMDIDALVKLISPREKIILCVDGPAPLSKQQQQRSRRFLAARERMQAQPSSAGYDLALRPNQSSMAQGSNITFNSNCITPGTSFLRNLTKYVYHHIKHNIANGHWAGLQVIWSDELVPGEGEAKLLAYVRANARPNEIFCLHGLDADLIMLALGAKPDKFYLLREDTMENTHHLIDINAVRVQIARDLKWDRIVDAEENADKNEEKNAEKNTNKNIAKYDPYRAVLDFILMCFTVGNDFVPHIPGIEIVENGIEHMFAVYRRVGQHLCVKYKNGQWRFHRGPMAEFFSALTQYEQEVFNDKLNSGNFFPDPLLQSNSEEISPGKWKVNLAQYREAYYKKKLPGTNLADVCQDYLNGLHWVLNYYVEGVPHWQWRYPYLYAPFAGDLAHYVKTMAVPLYGPSQPYTPFLQLLCVLPPHSIDLLPHCLQQAFDTDLLRPFYPHNFDIDLDGKRKTWEAVPILPILDFLTVQTIYDSMIKFVSEADQSRNKIHRPVMLKYVGGGVQETIL